MPAVVAWMALEFQHYLEDKVAAFSRRRLVIVCVTALAVYAAMTGDVEGRWTGNLTREYLSYDDPEHREWLPGPGGIVYSNSMSVFYHTFFRNPHANWRYILGFESAMMPHEDLTIFRKIQWNFGAAKAFGPWVRKMRPEDRLIVNGEKGGPPDIPELEWNYTVADIWIGRRPK